MISLNPYLSPIPLVAILRGIKPDEAVRVADVLVGKGFRCLEVPLNSPDPLSSIRLMHKQHGEHALIGAGTVLKTDDVFAVKEAGGRLIVMPHCDVEIIRLAKQQQLICIPGASSMTEILQAIHAGADAIKLFPASLLTPTVIKDYRAVLPANTLLIPVGGITPQSLAPYFAVGANAFGLGSGVYKAGDSMETVALKADAYLAHLPKPT